MPTRDWQLRINDILDSIAKIESYTQGMAFESFKSDSRTVDAVVRNFTIIGEASRHIPEGIEERWSQLPWYEMRGMRNIVVHEYFGVDHQILWQTAKENLPPIVSQLQDLLEQES